MKGASGEARIAAMTDLLSELVAQRQEALDRVKAIDASQIAALMQQTPAGSVACQMLTPLPTDSPARR
ncbi:MAG: hypothetical protein AB7N65_11705 [Vicinamibacterales bacterium]